MECFKLCLQQLRDRSFYECWMSDHRIVGPRAVILMQHQVRLDQHACAFGNDIRKSSAAMVSPPELSPEGAKHISHLLRVLTKGGIGWLSYCCDRPKEIGDHPQFPS